MKRREWDPHYSRVNWWGMLWWTAVFVATATIVALAVSATLTHLG